MEPEELAGYCFRRKLTEDQLCALCVERGVAPEDALPAFRRMVVNRASRARPQTAPDEFLESRFALDGTTAVSGGQGRVEFGHVVIDNGARGDPVAIKFINRPPELPSGITHDSIEISSITSIDRTTKHLRRNLVEYLASGYWNLSYKNVDVATVVMPRAGLTLRKLLDDRTCPICAEEACQLIQILANVTHALNDIKPVGLIHRDLKPENILLYEVDRGADGPAEANDTIWTVDGVKYRPVVTDLGLAKRVVDEQGGASLTERDRGTVNYMAPEQFRGGRLTHHVDIYALGVLLVECLTLRVPFDIQDQLSGRSQGDGKTLDWHTNFLRRPSPMLRELTKHPMDLQLERVARKCLRKSPIRRYATAGELAGDLERFLSGGNVRADPLSPRLDEQDLSDIDGMFVVERRGRKRWRSLAVILSLLAAVIILGMYTYDLVGKVKAQEERDRSNADQLLIASPEAFIELARGLSPVSREILPHIRESALDPKLSPKQKARAILAWIRFDPSGGGMFVDDLTRYLVEAESPRESILVRDVLFAARVSCGPGLWKLVSSTTGMERFRALLALAVFDPESRRWAEHAEFVVQDLLKVEASQFKDLSGAFDPIRRHLKDPLTSAYLRRTTPEQGVRAATILARHYANDPAVILKLLETADGAQFQSLIGVLPAHAWTSLPDLRRVVDREMPEAEPTPAGVSEEVRKRHEQDLYDHQAYRRANAALALLRLGDGSDRVRVWQMLRHTPDPSARTYLLHAFSSHGVDSAEILEEYQKQRAKPGSVDVRRALILALGEYRIDDVAEGRREAATIGIFEDYLTDPDPGIHGAAEWLLQRWGQNDRLRIAREKLAGQSHDGRRWLIDRSGNSFTVVPSGVAFDMGSPEEEADREQNPSVSERLHRVRIPRSFAIATRPVTVADFDEFLKVEGISRAFLPSDKIRKMSPYPECPVINVSWLEAAAYCNFRSLRENLEPCYPASIVIALKSFKDDGKFEELDRADLGGMPANYLSLSGYRLPTEAEWEYTCRAGAVTARPFGRSDRMLDKYAYYAKNTNDERSFPVGRLKPNELGMFDMPGNVMQWCQELTPYPPAGFEGISEDKESGKVLIAERLGNQNRVLRGGAWLSRPIFHRSASRKEENNWHPYHGYGFRVARTLPHGAD